METNNMPVNLTLRLFDFCKGCDLFDTKDSTFCVGDTEYHTIMCKHVNACGRMKSKMEGNNNAE